MKFDDKYGISWWCKRDLTHIMGLSDDWEIFLRSSHSTVSVSATNFVLNFLGWNKGFGYNIWFCIISDSRKYRNIMKYMGTPNPLFSNSNIWNLGSLSENGLHPNIAISIGIVTIDYQMLRWIMHNDHRWLRFALLSVVDGGLHRLGLAPPTPSLVQ